MAGWLVAGLILRERKTLCWLAEPASRTRRRGATVILCVADGVTQNKILVSLKYLFAIVAKIYL